MESMIYAIAGLVIGLVVGWFSGLEVGMQDADQAREKEHHEHQD